MYQDILLQLDLSRDEAKIYEVLLLNGGLTASVISKKAGIERTLTYKNLDKLLQSEIIEKKETAKITLFYPTHPQKLELLMEIKKKALEATSKSLENLFPQMLSQFNLLSGKPNVQFFEGREGVKKVLFNTLNISEGETIYTFADTEAVMRHFNDINTEYGKKRNTLKIFKKILIYKNADTIKFFKNLPGDFHDIRILKDFNYKPFEASLQIHGDQISYLTFGKNHLIGITIEDKRIATMHILLFEALYQNSLPFDSLFQ